MEMGQCPASRTPHGRDPYQRSAAPFSPMETPWEQAALQQRWMDPCRGWSCILSSGSASRLRCRLGATLHTHFERALHYQPQPDVCRLDLALSWRCAYHAKRLDGRIPSNRCGAHPPGGASRRAHAGASVRRRLHPVPEAGSSIPLGLAFNPSYQTPCMRTSQNRYTRQFVNRGKEEPRHEVLDS